MLTTVIGISMEPTLHEGEVYHIKRLRTRSELSVGDIVIAEIDGKRVVKRIVKIRYIGNMPLYDLHGDNKKFSKNFKNVLRSDIKYKLTRPTLLTKFIRRRKDGYYIRQAAMCKNLGIKPPPEDMGLIRKLRYIYKQLQ